MRLIAQGVSAAIQQALASRSAASAVAADGGTGAAATLAAGAGAPGSGASGGAATVARLIGGPRTYSVFSAASAGPDYGAGAGVAGDAAEEGAGGGEEAEEGGSDDDTGRETGDSFQDEITQALLAAMAENERELQQQQQQGQGQQEHAPTTATAAQPSDSSSSSSSAASAAQAPAVPQVDASAGSGRHRQFSLGFDPTAVPSRSPPADSAAATAASGAGADSNPSLARQASAPATLGGAAGSGVAVPLAGPPEYRPHPSRPHGRSFRGLSMAWDLQQPQQQGAAPAGTAGPFLPLQHPRAGSIGGSSIAGRSGSTGSLGGLFYGGSSAHRRDSLAWGLGLADAASAASVFAPAAGPRADAVSAQATGALQAAAGAPAPAPGLTVALTIRTPEFPLPAWPAPAGRLPRMHVRVTAAGRRAAGASMLQAGAPALRLRGCPPIPLPLPHSAAVGEPAAAVAAVPGPWRRIRRRIVDRSGSAALLARPSQQAPDAEDAGLAGLLLLPVLAARPARQAAASVQERQGEGEGTDGVWWATRFMPAEQLLQQLHQPQQGAGSEPPSGPAAAADAPAGSAAAEAVLDRLLDALQSAGAAHATPRDGGAPLTAVQSLLLSGALRALLPPQVAAAVAALPACPVAAVIFDMRAQRRRLQAPDEGTTEAAPALQQAAASPEPRPAAVEPVAMPVAAAHPSPQPQPQAALAAAVPLPPPATTVSAAPSQAEAAAVVPAVLCPAKQPSPVAVRPDAMACDEEQEQEEEGADAETEDGSDREGDEEAGEEADEADESAAAWEAGQTDALLSREAARAVVDATSLPQLLRWHEGDDDMWSCASSLDCYDEEDEAMYAAGLGSDGEAAPEGSAGREVGISSSVAVVAPSAAGAAAASHASLAPPAPAAALPYVQASPLTGTVPLLFTSPAAAARFRAGAAGQVADAEAAEGGEGGASQGASDDPSAGLYFLSEPASVFEAAALPMPGAAPAPEAGRGQATGWPFLLSAALGADYESVASGVLQPTDNAFPQLHLRLTLSDPQGSLRAMQQQQQQQAEAAAPPDAGTDGSEGGSAAFSSALVPLAAALFPSVSQGPLSQASYLAAALGLRGSHRLRAGLVLAAARFVRAAGIAGAHYTGAGAEAAAARAVAGSPLLQRLLAATPLALPAPLPGAGQASYAAALHLRTRLPRLPSAAELDAAGASPAGRARLRSALCRAALEVLRAGTGGAAAAEHTRQQLHRMAQASRGSAGGKSAGALLLSARGAGAGAGGGGGKGGRGPVGRPLDLRAQSRLFLYHDGLGPVGAGSAGGSGGSGSGAFDASDLPLGARSGCLSVYAGAVSLPLDPLRPSSLAPALANAANAQPLDASLAALLLAAGGSAGASLPLTAPLRAALSISVLSPEALAVAFAGSTAGSLGAHAPTSAAAAAVAYAAGIAPGAPGAPAPPSSVTLSRLAMRRFMRKREERRLGRLRERQLRRGEGNAASEGEDDEDGDGGGAGSEEEEEGGEGVEEGAGAYAFGALGFAMAADAGDASLLLSGSKRRRARLERAGELRALLTLLTRSGGMAGRDGTQPAAGDQAAAAAAGAEVGGAAKRRRLNGLADGEGGEAAVSRPVRGLSTQQAAPLALAFAYASSDEDANDSDEDEGDGEERTADNGAAATGAGASVSSVSRLAARLRRLGVGPWLPLRKRPAAKSAAAGSSSGAGGGSGLGAAAGAQADRKGGAAAGSSAAGAGRRRAAPALSSAAAAAMFATGAPVPVTVTPAGQFWAHSFLGSHASHGENAEVAASSLPNLLATPHPLAAAAVEAVEAAAAAAAAEGALVEAQPPASGTAAASVAGASGSAGSAAIVSAAAPSSAPLVLSPHAWWRRHGPELCRRLQRYPFPLVYPPPAVLAANNKLEKGHLLTAIAEAAGAVASLLGSLRYLPDICLEDPQRLVEACAVAVPLRALRRAEREERGREREAERERQKQRQRAEHAAAAKQARSGGLFTAGSDGEEELLLQGAGLSSAMKPDPGAATAAAVWGAGAGAGKGTVQAAQVAQGDDAMEEEEEEGDGESSDDEGGASGQVLVPVRVPLPAPFPFLFARACARIQHGGEGQADASTLPEGAPLAASAATAPAAGARARGWECYTAIRAPPGRLPQVPLFAVPATLYPILPAPRSSGTGARGCSWADEQEGDTLCPLPGGGAGEEQDASGSAPAAQQPPSLAGSLLSSPLCDPATSLGGGVAGIPHSRWGHAAPNPATGGVGLQLSLSQRQLKLARYLGKRHARLVAWKRELCAYDRQAVMAEVTLREGPAASGATLAVIAQAIARTPGLRIGQAATAPPAGAAPRPPGPAAAPAVCQPQGQCGVLVPHPMRVRLPVSLADARITLVDQLLGKAPRGDLPLPRSAEARGRSRSLGSGQRPGGGKQAADAADAEGDGEAEGRAEGADEEGQEDEDAEEEGEEGGPEEPAADRNAAAAPSAPGASGDVKRAFTAPKHCAAPRPLDFLAPYASLLPHIPSYRPTGTGDGTAPAASNPSAKAPSGMLADAALGPHVDFRLAPLCAAVAATAGALLAALAHTALPLPEYACSDSSSARGVGVDGRGGAAAAGSRQTPRIDPCTSPSSPSPYSWLVLGGPSVDERIAAVHAEAGRVRSKGRVVPKQALAEMACLGLPYERAAVTGAYLAARARARQTGDDVVAVLLPLVAAHSTALQQPQRAGVGASGDYAAYGSPPLPLLRVEYRHVAFSLLYASLASGLAFTPAHLHPPRAGDTAPDGSLAAYIDHWTGGAAAEAGSGASAGGGGGGAAASHINVSGMGAAAAAAALEENSLADYRGLTSHALRLRSLVLSEPEYSCVDDDLGADAAALAQGAARTAAAAAEHRTEAAAAAAAAAVAAAGQGGEAEAGASARSIAPPASPSSAALPAAGALASLLCRVGGSGERALEALGRSLVSRAQSALGLRRRMQGLSLDTADAEGAAAAEADAAAEDEEAALFESWEGARGDDEEEGAADGDAATALVGPHVVPAEWADEEAKWQRWLTNHQQRLERGAAAAGAPVGPYSGEGEAEAAGQAGNGKKDKASKKASAAARAAAAGAAGADLSVFPLYTFEASAAQASAAGAGAGAAIAAKPAGSKKKAAAAALGAKSGATGKPSKPQKAAAGAGAASKGKAGKAAAGPGAVKGGGKGTGKGKGGSSSMQSAAAHGAFRPALGPHEDEEAEGQGDGLSLLQGHHGLLLPDGYGLSGDGYGLSAEATRAMLAGLQGLPAPATHAAARGGRPRGRSFIIGGAVEGGEGEGEEGEGAGDYGGGEGGAYADEEGEDSELAAADASGSAVPLTLGGYGLSSLGVEDDEEAAGQGEGEGAGDGYGHYDTLEVPAGLAGSAARDTGKSAGRRGSGGKAASAGAGASAGRGRAGSKGSKGAAKGKSAARPADAGAAAAGAAFGTPGRQQPSAGRSGLPAASPVSVGALMALRGAEEGEEEPAGQVAAAPMASLSRHGSPGLGPRGVVRPVAIGAPSGSGGFITEVYDPEADGETEGQGASSAAAGRPRIPEVYDPDAEEEEAAEQEGAAPSHHPQGQSLHSQHRPHSLVGAYPSAAMGGSGLAGLGAATTGGGARGAALRRDSMHHAALPGAAAGVALGGAGGLHGLHHGPHSDPALHPHGQHAGLSAGHPQPFHLSMGGPGAGLHLGPSAGRRRGDSFALPAFPAVGAGPASAGIGPLSLGMAFQLPHDAGTAAAGTGAAGGSIHFDMGLPLGARGAPGHPQPQQRRRTASVDESVAALSMAAMAVGAAAAAGSTAQSSPQPTPRAGAGGT